MPRPKKTPTLPILDDPTVSNKTQVDKPRVIPLDAICETKEKPLRGDPQAIIRSPGKGAVLYNDKSLSAFLAQPLGKQGETTRLTWSNTAYVLALRAKRAAQSFSKKDFNALYRLVLSAGIAFDKAFPQQVQPLSGNLVVQLFGSLGSETARRILEPSRPTIVDITPVLVPSDIQVGSDTKGEPTDKVGELPSIDTLDENP